MRHNIIVDGIAFRLRPVEDSDVPLLLALRGNPELNKYLHATSPLASEQLNWLTKYYERPGDFYFVIERKTTGMPEGVISVYDIDSENISGEWGRWILKLNSLAAIESTLLIYRCAFEVLDLSHVFCRTVMNNQSVVSFHDSCGITNKKILKRHFSLNDQLYDAVQHTIDRECWHDIKPKLEKLSRLTARRLEYA